MHLLLEHQVIARAIEFAVDLDQGHVADTVGWIDSSGYKSIAGKGASHVEPNLLTKTSIDSSLTFDVKQEGEDIP